MGNGALEALALWQNVCYGLISLYMVPMVLLYLYDVIAYLCKLLNYGCRWSIYVSRRSPSQEETDRLGNMEPFDSRESLFSDSPEYHYGDEKKAEESPLYTIVLNGGLFIAGVAFIQSPLMEMMAPQL
ncbi:uncharacterized protein ZBAI_06000 [Zygosaccharomyces bailii ISA1307]|nr:uncharacterized protein ZBAI_06000 [Zygosaccharomyces bailii ISA1307]